MILLIVSRRRFYVGSIDRFCIDATWKSEIGECMTFDQLKDSFSDDKEEESMFSLNRFLKNLTKSIQEDIFMKTKSLNLHNGHAADALLTVGASCLLTSLCLAKRRKFALELLRKFIVTIEAGIAEHYDRNGDEE